MKKYKEGFKSLLILVFTALIAATLEYKALNPKIEVLEKQNDSLLQELNCYTK